MNRAEFWTRVKAQPLSGLGGLAGLLAVLGNEAARAVLEHDREAFSAAIDRVAALAWWIFMARAATNRDATAEVDAERERQRARWGRGDHSAEKWLAILLEEAGEVAQAAIDGNDLEAAAECVQVIAVCLRIHEEFLSDAAGPAGTRQLIVSAFGREVTIWEKRWTLATLDGNAVRLDGFTTKGDALQSARCALQHVAHDRLELFGPDGFKVRVPKPRQVRP